MNTKLMYPFMEYIRRNLIVNDKKSSAKWSLTESIDMLYIVT